MASMSDEAMAITPLPGKEQFIWLGDNCVLVVPTKERWDAMLRGYIEDHDPGDEDRR